MPQFRAKARAVDLLGKGQIADLPTAITELWKNGYDAYGDNLEAFLYEEGYEDIKTPIFVVSDDGKGMDRDDILEKWIVLGTDSKTRNTEDVIGEETLWKPARIKMGEKGIGRLSVAFLGSPMLMLTKKKNFPLQAVFFDWRLLENYNLFLEDVNIPIRSIEDSKDANQVFEDLKKELLANFDVAKGKKDPWSEQIELKNSIIHSSINLKLPNFFFEEVLSPLIGTNDNIHGTRFVIFEPDPQVMYFASNVMDRRDQSEYDVDTIDYLRSGLAGLFNTFKNDSPPCQTHLWIVNNNGRYDFIDRHEFFTESDFNICDHLIDGRFDEFGIFTGKVRIFETEVEHQFRPHRLLNKHAAYGPFNIKIGYDEATIETPRLNGEARTNFRNKLSIYAGLYIYRDEFRVLPYGRKEADFLGLEEKRSKGVGHYFFSYRRIFGYIDITRKNNEKLRDKAGREGFQNNSAFREFKKDLQTFFIDLAKQYFGSNANSPIKEDQKNVLNQQADQVKIEQTKETQERKEFTQQLKVLPNLLGKTENEFSELNKKLESKLEQQQIVYEELEQILYKINQLKIQLKKLNIQVPSRYKLTEAQRKRVYDFSQIFDKVQTTTVAKGEELIRQAQLRLKEKELLKEFESRKSLYMSTLSVLFDEWNDQTDISFRRIKQDFNNEKIKFTSSLSQEANALVPNTTQTSTIENSILLLEQSFNETRELASQRVQPFISHLNKLTFEIDEDSLVGYYKIKYEQIEQEWRRTRELAQLGIAVEIIDHQFNILYSQLANSIERLKEDIPLKKESQHKYTLLVNAFSHLEGNYKLLQPLYRTTGRTRRNISAIELCNYVKDFFSELLIEKNIVIEITDSAELFTFFTYDSVLKPVVINIVNNAIYWLQSVENRKIRFDANNGRLIIANSGPRIDNYLLDDIFQLFYSKRPDGRGIGLYLAKTSLNGINFDVSATNDSTLNTLDGACFIIEPLT